MAAGSEKSRSYSTRSCCSKSHVPRYQRTRLRFIATIGQVKTPPFLILPVVNFRVSSTHFVLNNILRESQTVSVSAFSGAQQPLSDLTEETIRSFPLERVRANGVLLQPGQQCRICLRPYQVNQTRQSKDSLIDLLHNVLHVFRSDLYEVQNLI